MAVQQEIKSQLAKLLATEDIVVEHKNVDQAQFNVQSRVLILPLWEKASNDVYDMLVGHEVGHALFTPDVDPPRDIPFQFVNVVEDARIEKLMKRKYLGIAKSFYRGYNELYNEDYFEVDGQNISSFNLADRANLHFKVGSFLDIPFSTPETEIINLIKNAETFTDTIAAAEALYNFCKQEQEKEESQSKKDQAKQDALMDIEGSGDSDIGSTSDDNSSLPDTDSNAPVEDRVDNTDSDIRVDDSDITVETAETLSGRIKDLSSEATVENVYVEVPTLKLDKIIINNKIIHEEVDIHFNQSSREYAEARSKHVDEIPADLEHLYPVNPFSPADLEFNKFKKDAQKEVSYLVKEFECRKSASAYARSATSRTGVLDTEKLSSYRFSEDLFKRVTVLPDGKNHGLVFVLDWSGSMQYVLQDTLKQLYNLMWFCKKVQIPFEVYAFTQEWNRRIDSVLKPQYEKKEGVLIIDDYFSLLNIFTSKANGKTLEHQMLNMWRTAYCFANRTFYNSYSRLNLSGTPLNESLIALHQILPKFKKENNVEKVQCIVLSDGEGSQLPYNTMVKRHWESVEYLGARNCHGDRSFLRDRKLGKTYKLNYAYHQFSDALLNNLQDRFPSTNFIGIRVLANRDAKYFIRLYHGENERLMSEWRKNKSVTITNSGYNAYFALSSTILSQDAEFDVDDDATKAQIKRAFVKSLKTKKLNKKVLGEFIELVA